MPDLRTQDEVIAYLREALDKIRRGTTDSWVREVAQSALLAKVTGEGGASVEADVTGDELNEGSDSSAPSSPSESHDGGADV